MFRTTVNIRFDRLVKRLQSESSKELLLRLFAEEIAESSKKYITQGKVKPNLNTSTMDHRERIKKKATAMKPLFFSRNLRDSIRPTNRGVSFAGYGQHHREGYSVPSSKYADTFNFTGATVPPREFISYFADNNEKQKIIRKVKRRFVNEINK
jgi:hypothetical protein